MVLTLARYTAMVGTLQVAADDAEEEFWSQQDGVTLHTARETTDCLTAVPPGRIILRFGDSTWPARFPDARLRFLGHSLTLRRLMSHIYGAPILDVSRSHTTTQHSR